MYALPFFMVIPRVLELPEVSRVAVEHLPIHFAVPERLEQTLGGVGLGGRRGLAGGLGR